MGTLPRESRLSPLAGLFVSAFVHVGLLAWGLRSTTAFAGAEAVPYSSLITGVAALGLILIIAFAIFARDSELFFVVVPAMLTGGVYAWAVRTVALDLVVERASLAALLRFGALGVALNLSMAAGALAARTAPIRIKLQLLGADGLWLGWLGLGAVFVASILFRSTAPLPLILSMTGIIVLQVNLAATQVAPRRHSAMAMLVSSIALSLAAVWTASIAASVMTLADQELDFSRFLSTMRFGWLGAMPLVLAALIALFRRVEAIGIGVKFGKTMVTTTVSGALITVGLSGAALAQAFYALSSQAASAAQYRAPNQPADVHRGPGRMNSIDSERLAASARGTAKSQVRPTASSSTGKTLSDISIHTEIEGPLLFEDTQRSLTRAKAEFVECHKRSQRPDRELTLSIQFVVSEHGSVSSLAPAPEFGPDDDLFKCLSLALYHLGFPSASNASTVTARLTFAPAI